MSFNVSYIYELRDQMSAKLRKIRTEMAGVRNRVRKDTTSINKDLGSMKSSLKSVALAYVSFNAVRGVVRNLEDYERALNRANALTRATTLEKKILRDMSGSLGASTEKTASQIAKTAGEMGLLGLSVKQINTLMPSVVNLSTALGKDLSESGGMAIGIMQKLNLPLERTGEILNKIATASTSSGVNLDALSAAFRGAGASIVSSGADVNEALAIMSVGYERLGDRVGFGFEAMLRQVTIAQDQASVGGKILKKYGIAYDDVNPKINSVMEVVKKLAPVLKNGADAQKLFGTEGLRLPSILLTTQGRVASLRKEIKTNTTALSDAAKEMRSGLPGAMDRMRSAIDGIVKVAGEGGLTKTIENLAKTITSLANFLNTNQWLIKAALQVGKLALQVFLLNKAIKLLGIARMAKFIRTIERLGKSRGIIIALRGAMVLLGRSLIALAVSNPFTLIIMELAILRSTLQAIPDLMDKLYSKFSFLRKALSFLIGGDGEMMNPEILANYQKSQTFQGQNQNNFNGNLQIQFDNQPQNVSTRLTTQSNSNMNVGMNSIYAT